MIVVVADGHDCTEVDVVKTVVVFEVTVFVGRGDWAGESVVAALTLVVALVSRMFAIVEGWKVAAGCVAKPGVAMLMWVVVSGTGKVGVVVFADR